MSKELIIFDMDGTLVDSSLTIARAINHVRKNLSLDPMDEHYILDQVNNPNINAALHFYEASEFTQEHEIWFSGYYAKNHEEELKLYDGIKELLLTLKTKGFKLAVATNAYKVSTLQSLGHLQILELFDGIACYDEVKNGKPHPDMLKKLLNELNIDISNAIFIGDGERDQLAAEAIEMDYFMVNWGFSDHEENVIHTVNELNKKILEIQ